MSEPRRVAVLGSTGSIGTQALDVIRANPDRFRVVALTAGGGNRDLFDAQVAEWSPGFHGLGEDASIEAAALDCDVVLNGITGAVGLRPTLAALDAGNTLALANKESLIIGGPVVTGRAGPGQIVPVDSEHSALAQCLRGGSPAEVRRLVLTASGGPFRGRTFEELADVTCRGGARPPHLGHGPGRHDQLRDAGEQGARGDRGAPPLRHPLRPDRGGGAPDERGALDGGVRRRLDPRAGSPPTMLIPIALGLAWPDRVPETAPAVDWTRAETWEFFPLDDEAFPSVALARAGGHGRRHGAGGLQRRERDRGGGVPRRPAGVPADRAHDRRCPRPPRRTLAEQLTVDDVLAADAWARREATSLVLT